MSIRTVVGIVVAMFVVAIPGKSGGKEDLQKYFNDAAARVKASANSVEKREILSTSLATVSNALEMAQHSSMVPDADRLGIARIRATLVAKQDELAGRNGYARVPDTKLNAFSDYVVQDTEQAVEVITISVVTLLLIIILIVLMVK